MDFEKEMEREKMVRETLDIIFAQVRVFIEDGTIQSTNEAYAGLIGGMFAYTGKCQDYSNQWDEIMKGLPLFRCLVPGSE